MNVVRGWSAETRSSIAWIVEVPRWNRGSTMATTASTPGSSARASRASRSCSGLAAAVASTTAPTEAEAGSSRRSRASVCWVRSGGRRPYPVQRSRTALASALPFGVAVAQDRHPPTACGGGWCTSRAAVSASSRGEATRVTPVRRHHASTASSSSLPRPGPSPAGAAVAGAAWWSAVSSSTGSPTPSPAPVTAQVRARGSATPCRQHHGHPGPGVGGRERQQVAGPDVGAATGVQDGGDPETARAKDRQHGGDDRPGVADQRDAARREPVPHQADVEADGRVRVRQTDAARPDQPDAGAAADPAQLAGEQGVTRRCRQVTERARSRGRPSHRPRRGHSCGPRRPPGPASPR